MPASRVAKKEVTRSSGPYHMRWRPRYNRLVLMANRGSTADEMADELGTNTSYVYKLMGSIEFKQRLNKLTEKTFEKAAEHEAARVAKVKARELLDKAAVDAAKKIATIARNRPIKVSGQVASGAERRLIFDACKDILDRTGLKPVEVIETRERSYSPQEVAEAQIAITEMIEVTQRLSKSDSPFLLSRPKAEED